MTRLISVLSLFAVSGCGLILDFDPRPETASLDASFDASRYDLDANILVDSSLSADADVVDSSFDSGRVRPDGSLLDAAIDRDGSYDGSYDAASDASFDGDAPVPPDPCDDELGLCIRFTDPEPVSPTTAIISIRYWTEGGVTVDSGWTYDSCVGGLRRIDPNTVDCLYTEIPLSSERVIYLYPLTTTPRCDSTMCAGFFTGYWFWIDGISVPSMPGAGPVSLARRPTPHGMIMAVEFRTP